MSALSSCFLSLAAALSPDVVVEAEAPVLRTPDDGTFARPHDARWASDRRCLIRFFGEGRCEYELALPESGSWSIWLRYAAGSDVRLSAGLVEPGPVESGPVESGALTQHALPSTGGYQEKRDWAWVRLFEGQLAAGTHRFALAAAPIRPDCLLATQAEGEPDYLRPAPAPALDAETRARLADPLVPARPDWLDGATDYALPAWYEAARVSLHTRLSPRWRERATFAGAEEAFAGLGVPAYVRHLRTAGEGAWWPSAVEPVEPWAEESDVAGAIIERAHEHGLRLVAYYRHMEDLGVAEEHPGWVARDDRGQPYTHRNGHPRMCLASPYALHVQTRLLELARRGVDGFYFDETHQPKGGCWCGFCRAGFTRDTGLPHPASEDPDDPVWRRLQDWNNLLIESTFVRWRRAVHTADPNCVLLVSNNVAPDLMGRHTTGRLWRISDAVKTEFDKGSSHRARAFFERAGMRAPARDARLALGFALCRDGADGRPPHVWIPRIADERAARFATAGVLAHGGVANLDHPEETIPDAATFRPAIALAERVSPALAGTRPVRHVALHLPERARDLRMPDQEAAWREVLWPLVGAWTVCLRAHVPVGIVTDNQLAEGALLGYRALYLPAPADLDAAMRAAVERFRDGGGLVLERDPARAWHDPGEAGDEAAESFRHALDEAGLLRDAPVVITGPERLHVTAFVDASDVPAGTGERLVVAIANDFAWVHTDGRTRGNAPPAAEGVRVLVRDADFTSARDAASGAELEVRHDDGSTAVTLPTFDELAVVVFER